MFDKYLTGKVEQLPWCEQRVDQAGEIVAIMDDLRWLNTNGFLTINSQPRVNGVPSDDPVFGWGGKGGYVFQKAYVEFFVSAGQFKHLIVRLSMHHVGCSDAGEV